MDARWSLLIPGEGIGLLALARQHPTDWAALACRGDRGREEYHRALPAIRICGSSTKYRVIDAGGAETSSFARKAGKSDREKLRQKSQVARKSRGAGRTRRLSLHGYFSPQTRNPTSGNTGQKWGTRFLLIT